MFNDKILDHLANLARLNLNENEKKKLTEDLKKILDYVSEIQQVMIETDPLISIFDKVNLREDKPNIHEIHEIHETINLIKENFPSVDEEGYLEVPKVIEK